MKPKMMKPKAELIFFCDAACLVFASIIAVQLIFIKQAPWFFITLYWLVLVCKYLMSSIADAKNCKTLNKLEKSGVEYIDSRTKVIRNLEEE